MIFKKKDLLKTAEAYKNVFATEEGKLIMADLLKQCRVDVACFSDNSTSIIEHNAMRKIGLYLIGAANVSDDTIARYENNINERK